MTQAVHEKSQGEELRIETSSARNGQKASGKPAVCILLENYPAPYDRRVWQEACALQAAGYRVSIICPKRHGLTRSHEVIDGVEIYRYPAIEADTIPGFFIEYSWALICQFVTALRVFMRARFRVLQACNPPDTLFAIGAFFKLFGVRFVFDHHDLAPELFEDKFGKRRLLHGLVSLAERLTFRTADVSIATNESYREIAIQRGRMKAGNVFVVRSCLDLEQVHRTAPRPELKEGKRHLVVYLGVMEKQDGVDLLLDAIEVLVQRYHRDDTLFALIGAGSEVPRLKSLAAQKGIEPWVRFTGRISDEDLETYLSTADVGAAPDPGTALNDKCTMNKILHYMAYGIPIVLFDLTEGRRSADDAALYARPNDIEEFAGQLMKLLDSESLRHRLGAAGRKRIEDRLNWNVEKKALLRAYQLAAAGRPKDLAHVAEGAD